MVASIASANDMPPRSSRRRARSGPLRSSSSPGVCGVGGLGRAAVGFAGVGLGGFGLPGRPRWPRRSPRGRWRWSPPSRPDPTTSTPAVIGTARRRWLTGGARVAGSGIEAERTGYRSSGVREIPALRRFRPTREQQELGVVERRRLTRGTRPGVTPSTVDRRRARRRGASSSSSRGGEAGGPEVERRARRRRRRGPSRRSWLHAGGGVERLARLEVAHREVRRERADRERAARAGRAAAMPAEHVGLVVAPPRRPNPPWHRQIAASNSSSNGRGRGRRAPRTSPARPSASAASRASATKSGDVVDADDGDARAGRARASGDPGRTRRRAPACPGSSPSASTRKSTSCSRPLGERVPEVRRARGTRRSALNQCRRRRVG